MSEALPGLPAAPGATKPKDAAVALLWRQGPQGVELFWIRRDANMAAWGGYYAFPGGRVEPSDAQIAVLGEQGEEAVFRAAAARELFEETGVLIAEGAEGLSPGEKAELRAALLGKKLTFQRLLAEHSLALNGKSWLSAGRWITPPFAPSRYDARLFMVEVKGEVNASLSSEASDGGWIAPAAALGRWEEGKALLHPPNLHALQVFARFSTVQKVQHALQTPPYSPNFVATRLEFQRGIFLFPLETPTLPPARHTNVYVVGNGELLIVDPGAAEVRQYARLLAFVAGLKSEGRRPRAVFLTHHHQDHIGGALAVKERLGIPVWCHERTAERLPFPADELFKDGETISLAGLPKMKLRVLHTPGHARGHLCLMDEASRALIAGDMVSSLSTIVIDPPDGDMTDYLLQLARLRDLPAGTLYPAHGMPLPDGPGKLAEYIKHREWREQAVLAAIGAGGNTLQEIVAQAYADTPAAVHPVAERSAQAILIKLGREGRVDRREDHRYHKQ